jgi:hypothetical protein
MASSNGLRRLTRFSTRRLLALVALAGLAAAGVRFGVSWREAAREHGRAADFCETMRSLQQAAIQIERMTPEELARAKARAELYARARDRFRKAWPWQHVPDDYLRWGVVWHDPGHDPDGVAELGRKFYEDLDRILAGAGLRREGTKVVPLRRGPPPTWPLRDRTRPPAGAPRGLRNPT